MALNDWTTSFEALPPDSESAGLGDDRIRIERSEIRIRGQIEHDWGDATTAAGFADTGRHNPGSAKIFRATGALPTTLLAPDGSAQAGTLGAGDTGRMCLDQRGWVDVLQMWDGSLSTPGWVGVGSRPDLIINGAMWWNQRVASAKVITAGARSVATSYTLDRWAVVSTGGNPTVDQVTVSGLPTGAASITGLKITGAAGVSNVDLSQRVEAGLCTLWGGYVTVRLGWKYVDGAAGNITPSFRVDTAGGSDNWAVPTNRLAQAFAAGNDGFFSHTFDLSGLANYGNGCDFIVRFSGANDLNAITKSVVITDYGITPGQAPVRSYQPRDTLYELNLCRRYYQKTFGYVTAPAQNWIGGGAGPIANTLVLAGSGANIANAAAAFWAHNPEFRATPTVTTYNPRAAAATAVQMDGSESIAVTVTPGAASTIISVNPNPLSDTQQALVIGASAQAEL